MLVLTRRSFELGIAMLREPLPSLSTTFYALLLKNSSVSLLPPGKIHIFSFFSVWAEIWSSIALCFISIIISCVQIRYTLVLYKHMRQRQRE